MECDSLLSGVFTNKETKMRKFGENYLVIGVFLERKSTGSSMRLEFETPTKINDILKQFPGWESVAEELSFDCI